LASAGNSGPGRRVPTRPGGDLDHFAAARLDLEPGSAGHDLSEVEQEGHVAARPSADDGAAALEPQQIALVAHRACRGLDQRLLVAAAMERQVGIGDQAARPDDARGGDLTLLQHRYAAR
jgi:hypothetical protein